jgi:penicillin-binding protein 1A
VSWGRWRSRAAIGAALLVIALGAAFAGERALRTVLREEVEARLRARLGEVRLGQVRPRWPGTVEVSGLEVGSGGGAAKVIRVERLIVKAEPRRLLQGEIAVTTVEAFGVEVRAGERGRALRTWLGAVRAAKRQGGQGGGPPPAIRASDVRLRLELAGRELALGPLQVAVRLDGTAPSSQWLVPGAGEPWIAVGRGAAEDPSWHLVFGDLPLSPLAEAMAPTSTLHLDQGTASGGLRTTPAEGGDLLVELELRVTDVWVSGERLSERPVGPAEAGLRATWRWQADPRRLAVFGGQFHLGEGHGATIAVDAELVLSPEPRVRARASTVGLSYSGLLGAVPEALRPPPEVRRLDGPLLAAFEVAGPLARKEEWTLSVKLDLAPLRKAVGTADPLGLGMAFEYPVSLADGGQRRLRLAHDEPRFVPMDQVPEVLVRAILLSEDSGFFAHPGFDFPALWRHLVGAPDKRGVLRSGSTITQQLAKNLYLSREKTYVRKIREALATVALEGALPKERLLEIYLNVIEWGPGLYGLGEATAHYFGKAPADLSVREAIFLATIIPNPVKYHGYCSRGAITPLWDQRMRELVVKMHGAGALSDPQAQQGLWGPLLFAHGAERSTR